MTVPLVAVDIEHPRRTRVLQGLRSGAVRRCFSLSCQSKPEIRTGALKDWRRSFGGVFGVLGHRVRSGV